MVPTTLSTSDCQCEPVSSLQHLPPLSSSTPPPPFPGLGEQSTYTNLLQITDHRDLQLLKNFTLWHLRPSYHHPVPLHWRIISGNNGFPGSTENPIGPEQLLLMDGRIQISQGPQTQRYTKILTLIRIISRDKVRRCCAFMQCRSHLRFGCSLYRQSWLEWVHWRYSSSGNRYWRFCTCITAPIPSIIMLITFSPLIFRHRPHHPLKLKWMTL